MTSKPSVHIDVARKLCRRVTAQTPRERSPGAPRRIAVPLVDRANYGRMKPVLAAIQAHPGLELQVICTGSMVLERFGQPALDVERDGFPVSSAIYIEVEGSLHVVRVVVP